MPERSPAPAREVLRRSGVPRRSWLELQESFHAANRKDSVASLRRSRGGAHSKSAHTAHADVSVQSQQNKANPTPVLSHQFLLSCLANVSLPPSVVRVPVPGLNIG